MAAAAGVAAADETARPARRGWIGWLYPGLHPILFAVFPLLSLFAHNQSEVELGVLWAPLAISVATGALLYGAFLAVFKRPASGAAMAAAIVVALLYYGIFADKWGGLGGWFPVLWLAAFAALAVAVVRSRRRLARLTLILTAGAAVLVVGPLANIVVYQLDHPGLSGADPRLWPDALAPLPRSASRPDIYVLIPDDDARPDVLHHYFHYDDAAFLAALRRRGFVISADSRSPYSDSESNVAAALNMSYLSRFGAVLGAKSQDVRPVRRVIDDNRAARLLEPLGYRYVHLDTDQVTFPGAGNPDISPFASPDSFMNLWTHQSILREIGGPIGFDDAAVNGRWRGSIQSMFGRLTALATQGGPPRFVVFHTLLPHDPYLYGANGQAISFPGRTDDDLHSRLGMRYYLPQLEYVNRKLLETTDAILAHARTPPIVVIQSDEGFEAASQFGEDAQQDIRVKGLIALHLPGRTRLPSPLNAVNTLRLVFDRTFGARYPLLRSVSYPEGDFPYQFEAMDVRGVAK